MGSYALEFYARQLLLNAPWLAVAAAAVVGFVRTRRAANLVQCAGAALLLGTFLLSLVLTAPNIGVLRTHYGAIRVWAWLSLVLQALGFLVFIGGYCWDKLTAKPSVPAGFPVANVHTGAPK